MNACRHSFNPVFPASFDVDAIGGFSSGPLDLRSVTAVGGAEVVRGTGMEGRGGNADALAGGANGYPKCRSARRGKTQGDEGEVRTDPTGLTVILQYSQLSNVRSCFLQ